MKKFITILLTVALFVTATVLGVNSVYRVDTLDLNIRFVSEDAKIEAESLRADLAELYEKESVFTVKQTDAENVFANYPYFRMTEFKKEYPNKLVIEATEDAEVFSVEKDGGFYVLALDGTVLSVRKTPENRSDGKPNVMINGMEVAGEKGELCISEKLNAVLPLLKELSTRFNGLRSNLVSVEYQLLGGTVEQYNLLTKEGVVIRVQQVKELVAEKAEKITQVYFSLEDDERLKGSIYATNGSGKANAVYYPTDILFE